MSLTKVVILNWNGEELLRRFLPGVVHSVPAGVGVVVADNGSDDGSVQFVAENFPQIELIRFDRNYGFAGGYDKVFEQTDADYIVMLNSDVEPTEGWCEPLIEALDSDDRLAAVMPKILSFADRTKFEYAGAAGGFIDSLGYPFCRGRILSHVETDNGQYDTRRGVFWTSGACMAVRVAAFRDAGGLDADFFAHMEEIDLCWRFGLYGYRVEVEPRGKVFHLGGGTLPVDSPRKTYLNYRNNLAMMHKNLPDGQWWRLRLRMVADALSAAVYMVGGRMDLVREVRRAHRDYRAMRPLLDAKRAEIRRRTVDARPANIYGGSIILRYLFGRRTFGRLL